MRRSFGANWSSWCVPGVTRPIWLANSNLRPRRSIPGDPYQAIHNWVAQGDRQDGRREAKPAAEAGLSAAEREELTRLRGENKQLRVERDIRSRAAAWFARETGVVRSGSAGS
jgi:transposase